MTTSPNRSFSSTKVFGASDTGQTFDPADPFLPSEVSIDKISFANLQPDRHFAEDGGSPPRLSTRDEPVVRRGDDTR